MKTIPDAPITLQFVRRAFITPSNADVTAIIFKSRFHPNTSSQSGESTIKSDMLPKK